MGGNYQIYLSDQGLRIEAELAPKAQGEAAHTRIIELLGKRGITADLHWVAHIPRTGGKTRRIRPLSEREKVNSEACVLRAVAK
jgi:hypothetical protein